MIRIITSMLIAAITSVGILLAFAAAEKTGYIKKWLTRRMIVMSVISGAVCGISSFLHEYQVTDQIIDIILIVFMTLLTFTDIERNIVPNRILFVMLISFFAVAGISIIINVSDGLRLLFTSLAGSLFCGTVFLLCYIISRHQLGGGDVKLSFLMGLFLGGSRVISALVYGMILCLIFSLIKLARKKITLKDGIPLVPFLWIGTMITLITAA